MSGMLPLVPSSLCRIELFSLLFKTPYPEKTRAFYTSIFEQLGKERSTTSSLRFIADSTKTCNVEWEGRCLERSFHLQEDPDGRVIHVSPGICSSVDSFLMLPSEAVVLLRSQQIMNTLSFYRQTSSWQVEKHGNGPTHYSSNWCGTLVEIYPQRKSFPAQIELVLPVENLAVAVEQLKSQQFSFLQESPTSALLQDPDQRIVNIMKDSLRKL